MRLVFVLSIHAAPIKTLPAWKLLGQRIVMLAFVAAWQICSVA